MSSRRIEVSVPPNLAFEDLEIAAEAVGKVEESNPNAAYLVVKARHGFNPVRVRCSVLQGNSAASSLIEFSGRGQDVWGQASRKVIDALIEVLAAVVRVDIESTQEQHREERQDLRKCPYCAEDIQRAAIKCKHCGEFVEALPDDPA